MREKEVPSQIERGEASKSDVERPAAEAVPAPLENSVSRETQANHDKEEIEKIRGVIEKVEPMTVSAEERKKKMGIYQEKYLPVQVKKPSVLSGAARTMAGWWMSLQEKMGRMKIDGRERIPNEGPLLVVSNHFGGETGKLLGLFKDRPLHIAAGDELNWKKSGLRSWVLRKLGTLSVKESLANLTDEQKSALLARVPSRARAGYEKVVERERRGGLLVNLAFMRNAVATLARGEAVAVFPEGLFLYEGKKELRGAYAGIEFIAAEYQKLTGQELLMLPVGVTDGHIGVGEAVRLSEMPQSGRPVDQVMRKVAEQLPEEERGAYRQIQE